jgi:predicted alpha-1,6-mannanase (GH76 family)
MADRDRDVQASERPWADRAEAAEQAVRARFLRRLWALPGTLLGVSGSPARFDERVFGPFNYWWQAHVLDCLVDAYVRSPDYRRRSEIERFVNGIRVCRRLVKTDPQAMVES